MYACLCDFCSFSMSLVVKKMHPCMCVCFISIQTSRRKDKWRMGRRYGSNPKEGGHPVNQEKRVFIKLNHENRLVNSSSFFFCQTRH